MVGTVTVAICTYRRPAILDALQSLAGQQLAHLRLRVIVVDNDDTDRARPGIERAGNDFALNLRYLHVPGSNISLARNACLEACETDWLAFIDDDETATPRWLEELVAASEGTKDIAAIFGPMRAIYGKMAPDWLKQGDFHSTSVVFVDGVIRTGYTTNALINLHHPAVIGKRFDPALGKSGGEDTDFFDRIYQDGGRFAFSANAIVEEILSDDRQSLRWFLRRRFRSGQTHGRTLARRLTRFGLVAQICLAGLKAGLCLIMALVSCLNPVAWRGWLMRGSLHLGVIAYLLGWREAQLYVQKPLTDAVNR